ncbi:MAG TPA: S41 family peptidase [Caulobacter sp.]|nr:S41 family peptidase [Caulobacter sp.]
MRPILIFCLLLLFVGPVAAADQALTFDFERGDPAAELAGWTGGPANLLALDAEQPHAGRASLRVTWKPGAYSPLQMGGATRVTDAAPYRGKRVRLRAAVRFLGQRGDAGLYLAAQRQGVAPGPSDRMAGRRITSPDWRTYDATINVPDDATRIRFGVELTPYGSAWIDDASLTVIGPAVVANDPPKPLGDRSLRNLEAFARLYGYVRFFHPSDEAAAADWNRVALAGVQHVEAARSDRELAQALRELFLPLAPTLVIEPGGPASPGPVADLANSHSWNHIGLGLGGNPNYSSRRGPPPVGFAADEIAVLDLGQGLKARVRLVLPVQAPAAAAPSIAPRKPEGFEYTGDDRATRLAGVVIAWNIPQHFYPYFPEVGTDWPAELRKALKAAATDADGLAFETTLERMMVALHDGHASVSWSNPGGGLPVVFDWVEGQLVIAGAVPKSAGPLRVGDVVISIDGRPAEEAVAGAERLVSSPTAQWRRHEAIRRLTLADPRRPTRLTVRHADGAEESVEMAIPGPPAYLAGVLREPRPDPIADLRPGLLYVDMTRAQWPQLEAALPRMVAAQAVIFDMRGYPRPQANRLLAHMAEHPVTSAEYRAPIVTRPDRQAWGWKDSRWDIAPATPFIPGRKVFLTDGGAISQAESIMSVVESHRLGEIVGAPTAGTNGDVNPFTLPGGYAIRWTGLKVVKRDGTPHHGVGIRPTILAARTLRGVREGRDEVLERGIAAAGF